LQTDSTTLVPPGATARVDWTGNIIITLSRLLKKSLRLRDKGGRGDFLPVDGVHF
jgi:hypothetical protein